MAIGVRHGQKRFRVALIAVFASGLSGAQAIAARDIRVGTDAATIQAAIDAASDGDRVVVPAGVYRENVEFHGKAVTVVSEDGPAVTVIDAGGFGTTISFKSGEGPGSVLEGFTVRGGGTAYARDGGGIYTYFTSPTIRGNRVVLNSAAAGGGIRVYGGAPRIDGNEIAFNRSADVGGGIEAGGGGSSALEIIGNRIHDNVAAHDGGGLHLYTGGPIRVAGNTIVANHSSGGGGISAYNLGALEIVGNLVVDNRADEGTVTGTNAHAGGGVRVSLVWPLVLAHNTVAGNSGGPGTALWLENAPETTIVSNLLTGGPGAPAFATPSPFGLPWNFTFRSNVVDAGGDAPYAGDVPDRTGTDGNLTGDPRFVDPAIGDWSLASDSPAIDAGETTQWTPATDVFGGTRVADGNADGAARIDIGAIERNAAPAMFWFDAGEFQASEDSGTVEIGVCRSGTDAASVLVRTEGATARSGVDFDALDTVVQFAAGEARKVVGVRIRPDGFYEPNGPEAFLVTLTPVTAGATTGARAAACVYVADTPALVADYLPLQPGMTSRFLDVKGHDVSATVGPKKVVVRGVATRVIRWSWDETWNVTNDADGLRLHRFSGPVVVPGAGRIHVALSFDPPIQLAAAKPLEQAVAVSSGRAVSSPVPGLGVVRTRYSATFTASATTATAPLRTFDTIRVDGRLVLNGEQQPMTLDLAPGLGIVRYAFGADTAGIVSTNLGSHRLEVERVAVPASVRLARAGAKTSARVSVRLRNSGDRTEVIEDGAMLDALLAVDVASLGAVASPQAVRAGPKSFPIVLAPRAVAAIPFDVRITDANDPARGPGHEDFVVGATLDLAALDRFNRAEPFVPPVPAPHAESALDVVVR